MARLTIYTKTSDVRCIVEKWECVDKMMGENHITFTYRSPQPVNFEVGDWCMFRGERYTLNVEPSCTQKAKPDTYGQAFTYESVRMDSALDDLTRCTILDIVPTSGEHKAAYGTNYTGSANFSLNCFETTFVYQGETIYYAPAHALLDRIKANLDRLYPDAGWQIYIDDSKCHSDDFIITFNNWTASQALAEVHNTFKLDFVVRGRKILVGDVSALIVKHPELKGLTGYVTDFDGLDDPLFFGYGKGYLSKKNQGKSLFQIKKIAKSDQQIVTRLRAMGSTKNMPYRYYHKKYGTAQSEGDMGLPQTMFVQNLQLPDTFIPYDSAERSGLDYYKTTGNANRDDTYKDAPVKPNHILGATNDAYIDKNNDAASCPEGIRECTARWDGSDGDLPEIYPTIEEATYGELRANNVPDMDGATGSSAFPNYDAKERLDEILYPGSITADDCNMGDGIMSDSEAYGQTTISVPVTLQRRTVEVANGYYNMSLFSISQEQERGDYLLSYTTQKAVFRMSLNPGHHGGGNYKVAYSARVMINIVEQKSSGGSETVATYTKIINKVAGSGSYSSQDTGDLVFILPDFHDQDAQTDGWSTDTLHLSERGTVSASLQLNVTISSFVGEYSQGDFAFAVSVNKSNTSDSDIPNAIWGPSSSAQYYSQTPFHLTLKDIGVDFSNVGGLDGDEMKISMKSGQCAGREFTVKAASAQIYNPGSGKRKGWTFELDRVVDDSLHTYFPSANNQILAGDQYVLLNIELPDAYIKAAEMRLLMAATEHLADNCDTKYTYQPSVDDIYLQRNMDFHRDDPENSVFWRLRSGMKFPFYGIPGDKDTPLPIADITIEQVVIRMGEKSTPQVDITLNDEVEQSMIQKIQISVDRLYGSVFNASGTTSGISTSSIHQALSNYFLSKENDDVAAGYISFTNGINVSTLAEIARAIFSDDIRSTLYTEDFTGSGWRVDADGNATFDSLTVRGAMRVFELLIQKVRATGGEIIVSAANGRVKSATLQSSGTYHITLENEGDNFGNMFQEHDFVLCQKWDKQNQTMKKYWGFVSSVANNVIAISKHYFVGCEPEAGDELVLLGSTNAGRRSAITISSAEGGTPKITVLDGIKGENVWSEEDQRYYAEPSLVGCTRAVLGDLSGIVDESMGALEGYGLYSDNVYLKGKLAMSNGTLISDELTSIKSGEIHLSGKTTVDNDFFVRSLETLPDTSEDEGNKAKVKIEGSLMEVFGATGACNIRFGVDTDTNCAVLKYYDNDGNFLYDLGPSGLRYINIVEAKYITHTLYKISDGSSVSVYYFTAKRVAGVITADTASGEHGYAPTDEIARLADGLYFTSNGTITKTGDTLNNLARYTGLRRATDNAISVNNNHIKEGWETADDVKNFLKDTYGLSDSQLNDLDFTLVEDVDGKMLKNDITLQRASSFINGQRSEYWIITQE